MTTAQQADDTRWRLAERKFVSWTMHAFRAHKPKEMVDPPPVSPQNPDQVLHGEGQTTIRVTIEVAGRKKVVALAYNESFDCGYEIYVDPDDEHYDDILDAVRGVYAAAAKAQELESKAANDNRRPTSTKLKAKRETTFVRASDVEMENVDWLWTDRLARGCLHIAVGDTGLGKSQIAASFTASLTKSRRWADGTEAPSGSVVILGSEEPLNMVTRPRLEAAGADASRVYCLRAVKKEDGGATTFSVQQDLESLAEVVREVDDVALIIIDPITSYLGAEIDSHRTTDVRAALEPLCRFAEEHGVAILMITHPTKATQAKAIHLALGSGAFVHLPRVGFLVIPDPDEPGRRLMLTMFNNIGPPAKGIGYKTEEVYVGPRNNIRTTRVVWDSEPVNITADHALAKSNGQNGGDDRSSARQDAMNFLRKKLADGPKPAKDLEEEAKVLGISERTLRRARQELEIDATKDGFQGTWHWKLPSFHNWHAGAKGGHKGGQEVPKAA